MYVNDPSWATVAVPWAGGEEIVTVTIWPVSGSFTGTVPATGVVAPVETVASPTMGAVLPTDIVPGA